jgi:hypothetical protein
MQTDFLSKVERFVTWRHESAQAVLNDERDAKITAISEDLGARGFGYVLDPNDSRFDQVKLDYYKAVLLARADALFEAYEVYGLPVDDYIWQQLNRYKASFVAATKGAIRHQAGSRATRTGRNPAQALARAESLGMKIERSTHTYMKSLFCDIEKRKHLPKTLVSVPTESAPTTSRHIRKRGKPGRRDTVIFAAILLRLKGLKYCSFLQEYGVRPKWSDSDSSPESYPKSYRAGEPWRKRVQDEKARARARMDRYTDAELADAFSSHLPDRIDELRRQLATREAPSARAKLPFD